jgi:hypothetical protein
MSLAKRQKIRDTVLTSIEGAKSASDAEEWDDLLALLHQWGSGAVSGKARALPAIDPRVPHGSFPSSSNHPV